LDHLRHSRINWSFDLEIEVMMTPVESFRGESVAVFGLGGSGLSTVKALEAGGAYVAAWDDSVTSREAARQKSVALVDLSKEDFSHYRTLILAPGVPLTHPEPHWSVKKAKAVGIPVIGDIELFCRERQRAALQSPFVAITGTNGKSTTTSLIAHLLSSAGRDVALGGNIGTAVLDLPPPSLTRYHVLECSSFQIDLTPSIAPTVGVLLNITPDHLDRHGTMENYASVKERLVASAELSIIGDCGTSEERGTSFNHPLAQ
jgi:UDP-N-acetylmuramoylalanine--D-glutamate ligase